jgi:hypothetical protein
LTFKGAEISIGPLLDEELGDAAVPEEPVSFFPTALTAGLSLLSGLLGYAEAAGGGERG